jgi:hypothetical protein
MEYPLLSSELYINIVCKDISCYISFVMVTKKEFVKVLRSIANIRKYVPAKIKYRRSG